MAIQNGLDMSPEGKFQQSLKFLKTEYYKTYARSIKLLLKTHPEIKVQNFGLTSEKDLDDIIRRSAFESAKSNLNRLRIGIARNPANTIKDLRQDIENGQIPLEMLKTSEQELSKFVFPS
jgi:hypothetical protein